MKKGIFTFSILLMVSLFFSSCTTIPQNPNLTGSWSYKFVDAVADKEYNGTMSLTQNVNEVKGKANDAFGEFAVSGTVPGPKFILKFVKNDKTLNYTVNVAMTSVDSFKGTFTTTSGKAGRIEFKRN